MKIMTNIISVETPSDLEEIRCLFREYENFIGVDLCFQGFEKELKTLPSVVYMELELKKQSGA